MRNLNFISFSRPFLIGVIATDSTGPDGLVQWRTVFWIAFVIFNVTNIVYVIWASGEIQPFNDGAVNKNRSTNSLDNSENSTENASPDYKSIKFDQKLINPK
jgi:hypothetical protein